MSSEEMLGRVETALSELATAGRAVTFSYVATAAGLGRATLYRNPTLRALVEEHRARQNEGRTLSGLSAEIVHLRTALEEIAARVRSQEERLRRLEGRRTARSS